jgi:hypothetical protein
MATIMSTERTTGVTRPGLPGVSCGSCAHACRGTAGLVSREDGERGAHLIWDASGMDARDSANPVVLTAERWLARLNARHPWNHNEHFHGWILRNLPDRRQAAVDVGCGAGVQEERRRRARESPFRAVGGCRGWVRRTDNTGVPEMSVGAATVSS